MVIAVNEGSGTIKFFNTTERMRIDASGNLLIGTTDTSGGTSTHVTQGIALSAGSFGGFIGASRSGDKVASFNRNSSDGTIVDFRKGGSTVGAIGNAGVRLFINSGTVGLNFAGDGSDQILPSNAGANRDAAIDLGTSNVRFKSLYISSDISNGTRSIAFSGGAFAGNGSGNDANIDLGRNNRRFADLYLSGGIHLGGTGSANQLQDYEEGTWTPALSNGGTIGTTYGATYTKIGNTVIARVYLNNLSIPNNNSEFRISGLPFTVRSGSYYGGLGSIIYVHSKNIDAFGMGDPVPYSGATIVYFHRRSGTTATVVNSDVTGMQAFIFGISYEV